MDQLDAPDQGAIQGERGPSRWAGPEIDPTVSYHEILSSGCQR
jgi:hypothetical protein